VTTGPGSAGCLYVVATPIGNLGDLSVRALEVLRSVTLVAAEDTRRTGAMLRHFGVDTPLVSLHEHNERQRVGELTVRLQRGESIALVTDAGTPLLSDPGYLLVSEAARRGIATVPVPGPSALTAALSIAALPVDRFVFEGFLPAKPAARRNRLEPLRHEGRTLVFYEAPHRLARTLEDLVHVLGEDRPAVVARELTKSFETVYRDSLAALARRAVEDPDMRRGELVIVVAGAPQGAGVSAPVEAQTVLRSLLDELPPSQAARITARLTGVNRSQLYALALELGKRGPVGGRG